MRRKRVTTCDDCGNCCAGQGFLPYGGTKLDGTFRSLPREIKADLKAKMDAKPYFEGRCIWFDPAIKGCKHYDLRPSVCQNFEIGGESCLRRRKE